MRYQTKGDRDAFQKRYLDERMGHVWSASLPVHCEHCAMAYNERQQRNPRRRKRCPGRHKPNRWRLHCRRALARVQEPARQPFGAATILEAMHDLEYEARRLPQDDMRLWKYHPIAAKYRRLMRRWWALPAEHQNKAFRSDPKRRLDSSYADGGWITRGRNRLIKQARLAHSRVIVQGHCTYTLVPSLFEVPA